MRNLILTGFMGTGKSSTGREVAHRLGRPFVDMDDRIVAHFGKPIPEVFAQEGEAIFRQVEAAICRQLAEQDGLVVATGGGALVNETNRQVLAANGILICLTATPHTILQRVSEDENRPLLAGDPVQREEKIGQLLAQRAAAYGAIPHQVATDGLSAVEVAQIILDLISNLE